MSAHSSPGPRASNTPILEERTSLDTLADRLNILSMKTSHGDKRTPGGSRLPRPYVPELSQGPARRPKLKPARTVLFCFCFEIPSDEAAVPPPRPRPRPVQSANPVSSTGSTYPAYLSGQVKHAAAQVYHSRTSSSNSHILQSSRRPSTASQTAQYLALISPTASPQTASALMAELAKPISHVDEPGYIYMFWLTPESQQASPPADAARSLLLPPPRPAGGDRRRASDVVASFAAENSPNLNSRTTGRGEARPVPKRSVDGESTGRAVHQANKSNGTLLLKIGRANNVQRRLNEWKRQCGYNLSLIRFYPYLPSSGRSPDVPGTAVPRKLPHSHKIERLIHIELAGSGLRVADGDKCQVCGREHREWFQVEATRKAIAEVDGIIRRWVDWDESNS